MTGSSGVRVLTDAQWAAPAPLIDEVRPRREVPHEGLRQTIEAIFRRQRNGAKWRGVPAELGPRWKAAQTFIRWAKLAVWERLLALARQRGIALGMTFVDGGGIRAHHKAAGAEKRGPTARRATRVRRLAALAAATGPRPA